MKSFGKTLKLLRKQKGLTQEELAKVFSVTRGSLANWEIDRANPDVDTLNKLADYFGVTTDYLLGREIIEFQMSDSNFLNLSELSAEQRKAVEHIVEVMRNEANKIGRTPK